jgi:hypothetical protein
LTPAPALAGIATRLGWVISALRHLSAAGGLHLIEMIEGTEDVRVASNALLRGLNRFLNMSRVHRKRAFVHPAGE